MKITNLFYRSIALIIILASLLSVFAACNQDVTKPPIEENSPTQEGSDVFDISKYTIVRRDASDKRVTSTTANLKAAIKEALGAELAVQTDWYNPNNAPDPNAKEILIDRTNRKESEDALTKLNESDDEDAFIIDITENKIAILGKTDISTARGITYFINNYVMTSTKESGLDLSAGKTCIQPYSVEMNISIENKLDIDVNLVSTILGVPEKNPSDILGYPSRISDVHFPSVIELQHQPKKENNGILIGAFCIIETAVTNPKNTLACIMKSTDKGLNWEVIARPSETIDTSTGWAGSMAHIYELPAKLGNLPAGTLIYSSNSVNYERSSHIGVWRSTDCGKTWKEISIVARGGGIGEGVWEPVMFYNEDDGYLYCFYSDDSNAKHDQKIVYKRSKDGVKWENAVDVCAFNKSTDRPGMPVITRLGNGEFFLVYEYVRSGYNSNIYYKKTKDITKWNPADPGTLIKAFSSSGANTYVLASGPSCLWTPAGGKNGTLFVTGQYQIGGVPYNSIFVSFDNGMTWEIVKNPLPYSNYTSYVPNVLFGYRPIMVTGADPSVIHYVNTTNIQSTGKSQIQYAQLKIYD
ncbi:MAG: exo-alpha-sialidase [Clostridia bacterium]|nr:exo-alpha-sialidase [Clostridia bacterium]